jgi:hypothetical protein
VHPSGQYSKECPQVEGHVLRLSARHAKLVERPIAETRLVEAHHGPSLEIAPQKILITYV